VTDAAKNTALDVTEKIVDVADGIAAAATNSNPIAAAVRGFVSGAIHAGLELARAAGQAEAEVMAELRVVLAGALPEVDARIAEIEAADREAEEIVAAGRRAG
jgi:hypothetical protein